MKTKLLPILAIASSMLFNSCVDEKKKDLHNNFFIKKSIIETTDSINQNNIKCVEFKEHLTEEVNKTPKNIVQEEKTLKVSKYNTPYEGPLDNNKETPFVIQYDEGPMEDDELSEEHRNQINITLEGRMQEKRNTILKALDEGDYENIDNIDKETLQQIIDWYQKQTDRRNNTTMIDGVKYEINMIEKTVNWNTGEEIDDRKVYIEKPNDTIPINYTTPEIPVINKYIKKNN